MLNRIFRKLKRRTLQRLTSRDAYTQWANNYPPTPHNRLMEIEQETMLTYLPDLSGKYVLDLACGTGRYGLIAQEQGAISVIGVDDSEAMLLESPLTNCIAGSMDMIPLRDAYVDVVLCGLAVGHSPRLPDILIEISRVLVDGGYALISDFHPFQYLSGARRTFEGTDGVYEVEHYVHLYETWHSACQKSGLQITTIAEPKLLAQDMPVVIVYQLQKG